MESQHMAYEQVDTQGSPTIPLNPAIDVVNFAPFAHGDRSMILTRDTWQATVFIQFTTICTAVGSIDIATGQLSGIKRHVCSGGGTNQRHDNRRPGEWCPARTMHRRLGEKWTKLLDLSPASHPTEDRGQVHG